MRVPRKHSNHRQQPAINSPVQKTCGEPVQKKEPVWGLETTDEVANHFWGLYQAQLLSLDGYGLILTMIIIIIMLCPLLLPMMMSCPCAPCAAHFP